MSYQLDVVAAEQRIQSRTIDPDAIDGYLSTLAAVAGDLRVDLACISGAPDELQRLDSLLQGLHRQGAAALSLNERRAYRDIATGLETVTSRLSVKV